MFALRYRGGQKGKAEGDRSRRKSESEGPCGRLRWNEKERREGGGWVNSGLRRFCNPVEASRGERGIGSAAVEDEKERRVCERAGERVRRRRSVSRREKAEGSRSFAGDGKRNRGGPRRIERVEIDAKDGGRERAAAAAAVTAAGGTKGGKGEILLTYTPTSLGPRAARPANARPGAREKERRQRRLGISPVARAQKAP